MAWWTRQKPALETRDPGLPLIRLDGVSKVFRGDADEETRALDAVSLDIAREIRLGVGPLGLRQVDVSLHPGAAGRPDERSLLVQRPSRGSAGPRRQGARAQRRRRSDLPELQPDWRHDGVRERRVSADRPRRGRRRSASLASTRRSNASAWRPAPSSAQGRSPADINSWSPSRARSPGARPSSLPTSRLETSIRRAAKRSCGMLDELHAGGSTICLATHDPDYIAMAQRHIYLFDGRVTPEPVNLIACPPAHLLYSHRTTV